MTTSVNRNAMEERDNMRNMEVTLLSFPFLFFYRGDIYIMEYKIGGKSLFHLCFDELLNLSYLPIIVLGFLVVLT